METAALPISGDAALAANGKRPETVNAGSRLRKRAAQHLERMQEATYAALAAVSSYLDSDEDLHTFFGRLSATIAQLVGARRAAFWRLGPRGVLALQPEPFGFADASLIHNLSIQMGANGRAFVEANFSRKALAEKYVDILREIVPAEA